MHVEHAGMPIGDSSGVATVGRLCQGMEGGSSQSSRGASEHTCASQSLSSSSLCAMNSRSSTASEPCPGERGLGSRRKREGEMLTGVGTGPGIILLIAIVTIGRDANRCEDGARSGAGIRRWGSGSGESRASLSVPWSPRGLEPHSIAGLTHIVGDRRALGGACDRWARAAQSNPSDDTRQAIGVAGGWRVHILV